MSDLRPTTLRTTVGGYPLQGILFVVGVATGLLVGLLTLNPLAGLTMATLPWLAGVLWRRDDPPILAFCLCYQWFYFAAGYYFWLGTGSWPGRPFVGDVPRAVLLSAIGLLVVAAGLRMGMAVTGHWIRKREAVLKLVQPYHDVRRLFWIVASLFAFEWFVELSPMHVIFRAAQFVGALLAFRYVLLFLFFLVVIRQREGYGYGFALFVFALVPSLASKMSGFKVFFFLLLLALLAEWKPWSRYAHERKKALKQVPAAIVIGFLIIALGTIWIGGVKGNWRRTLSAQGEEMSRVEKVQEYLRTFDEAMDGFSWRAAAPAVLSRLSSGAAHFSLALERVPDIVPYENGELTTRAILHVTRPRIFFPDKENLGGDSWLVEKYAGVRVAGNQERTSIGFSYIGEFFVDFGPGWMFAALLLLGFVLGSAYRTMARFAPSYALYSSAVTVIFIEHFVGYESELAKMMGGFLMKFAVFGIVLSVLGRMIHQFVTRTRPTDLGRAPTSAAGYYRRKTAGTLAPSTRSGP